MDLIFRGRAHGVVKKAGYTSLGVLTFIAFLISGLKQIIINKT
jgi:hypothetical protein